MISIAKYLLEQTGGLTQEQLQQGRRELLQRRFRGGAKATESATLPSQKVVAKAPEPITLSPKKIVTSTSEDIGSDIHSVKADTWMKGLRKAADVAVENK